MQESPQHARLAALSRPRQVVKLGWDLGLALGSEARSWCETVVLATGALRQLRRCRRIVPVPTVHGAPRNPSQRGIGPASPSPLDGHGPPGSPPETWNDSWVAAPFRSVLAVHLRHPRPPNERNGFAIGACRTPTPLQGQGRRQPNPSRLRVRRWSGNSVLGWQHSSDHRLHTHHTRQRRRQRQRHRQRHASPTHRPNVLAMTRRKASFRSIAARACLQNRC
mmetsp:Transcript_64282/g.152090  ORF Transcript_64282/g.152090 Transcript_64282/m.152090 type:complete len:222 (+) Transcript_64282:326-991(+)